MSNAPSKKLWESNATPRLYNFTAKFWKKRGDSNPAMYRAFDFGVKYDEALWAFKEFFYKKTNIYWKDRVTLAGTETTAFQYCPPVGLP